MLDTPREVPCTEPDGEGCLDIALAAWLDLPGRCLSWNNRELVISSNVRSPKILTSGL